jgi:putative PEP-CTERM system histidine kinase
MLFSSLISIAAGVTACGIATTVVVRNKRSFINIVFSVGMALLGIEAILVGVTPQAASPSQLLTWEWCRLLASFVLSGVWLVFSVTFARANYYGFLHRWKWIIVLLSVVPLGVALFFRENLFLAAAVQSFPSGVVIRLGWAGYILYLVHLISVVLILMNIERTFKNATGHARWQIKFMVLGLACIFGCRLYADSQVILFRVLNPGFHVVNALALLMASILIVKSLSRSRMLDFEVYLSYSVIYNSFTVLIVGVYFIAVGVIANVAYYFQRAVSLPVVAFLVLLSVLGLAILFFSDRLRFKRKRFVSRHFKRPVYDYQKIWAGFTENTASLSNIRDLCLAINALVSQTLDILSVSLWLVDERQDRLELGSSTILTEKQARSSAMDGEMGKALLKLISTTSMPIDLSMSDNDLVEQFAQTYEDDLEKMGMRYCLPLRAAGKTVGIMTLGKRVMNQDLSFEDYELLRTLGDQSSAALLSLRLSEKLRQAKELEAFQVMSAFFMHDLKNLASKLSLVTQNMVKHYDNDEFRDDAMRTMAQSVDKIKGMCTRLSLLSQTPSINAQKRRLDELVQLTVAGVNGVLKSTIDIDAAEALPALSIDEEQMRKVLENLLINANEATAGEGHIRISVQVRDEWVVLSVSDNGCGMTAEFVEKYAFKPFQTTKKQGMGIGLFHCKTIVEAHEGRIEVQSEEGKGSTFRVYLPVKG